MHLLVYFYIGINLVQLYLVCHAFQQKFLPNNFSYKTPHKDYSTSVSDANKRTLNYSDKQIRCLLG